MPIYTRTRYNARQRLLLKPVISVYVPEKEISPYEWAVKYDPHHTPHGRLSWPECKLCSSVLWVCLVKSQVQFPCTLASTEWRANCQRTKISNNYGTSTAITIVKRWVTYAYNTFTNETMSVSKQLRTYPSPNLTTLKCKSGLMLSQAQCECTVDPCWLYNWVLKSVTHLKLE